jgi:glycosyltransferase involved in cell wall biosynthesis
MKNTTRILFDASPLLNNSLSGVGYYTKYIIEVLAKNESYELTGFYFNFLGRKKINLKTKYPQITFVEIKHFPGIILGPLARLTGLQPPIELFLNNNYDVHFYPNFTSYPSIHKTPQAVVVHDFCFIDHPEYVAPRNQKYLHKLTTKAIQRSSIVICVSESTRSTLINIYGDKDSVVITPPIIKVSSSNDQKVRIFTKNKYILFVSTLEPRKNIESLVDAYRKSSINSEYDLVLAGGDGWNDEGIVKRIEDAQKAGFNVIKTGYISEEERDYLYKNTALFVMPSHYEGFGMPILEAMQYNVPIAVSDIPVFHEVAGDSVVYFDKDNPLDIANTITNYLNDEAKKKKLVSTYQTQLNKYSWENNAKIVFNAFEKLVK